MNRRDSVRFLFTLGATAGALSELAQAQTPPKSHRIALVSDYRNKDGTQVGAIPGVQDDTTGFQAFLDALGAAGAGAAGYVPALPGSGYKITFTLKLPKVEGITIFGDGNWSTKIIFAPTVPGTDCFSSNNVAQTSTNGMQFLDIGIYTNSANARYGLNWSACNRSRIRVRAQGFSAAGSAGVYSTDSIIVDADLFVHYNYDGLKTATTSSSSMNAWQLTLSAEANRNLAANITECVGTDIDVLVSESNGGGGIDILQGRAIRIFGYLGEGNANFDVRLGTVDYVRGIDISGEVISISTIARVQTPHYPIHLKKVEKLYTHCHLTQGNAFVKFLPGNDVRNSTFGPLSFMSSSYSGDPSNKPPVNNPPGPLYPGCTYAGLDLDPGILTRGNIFEDYTTFRCSGVNLCKGDMPFGGWKFTTAGTSTWTRSPNTGATPDTISGRPVGLLTRKSDGVAALEHSTPIQTGSLLQYGWITFAIDCYFNQARAEQFNMTLEDGSAQIASVTYGGTNAARAKTFYVSAFLNSSAVLVKATLGSFTARGGSYKFSNPRIFLGMDPRTCSSMVGPPVFVGDAATVNYITAGTYDVGDRQVRHPVVGKPKAWSCTVAGTPGTWVSEGNL